MEHCLATDDLAFLVVSGEAMSRAVRKKMRMMKWRSWRTKEPQSKTGVPHGVVLLFLDRRYIFFAQIRLLRLTMTAP
jgi:hypothetical protein